MVLGSSHFVKRGDSILWSFELNNWCKMSHSCETMMQGLFGTDRKVLVRSFKNGQFIKSGEFGAKRSILGLLTDIKGQTMDIKQQQQLSIVWILIYLILLSLLKLQSVLSESTESNSTFLSISQELQLLASLHSEIGKETEEENKRERQTDRQKERLLMDCYWCN